MGIIGLTFNKIGSKIDSLKVDSEVASQKVENNVPEELDLDSSNIEEVNINNAVGSDIDYKSIFSDPEANQDKLGTMNEEEYNSYVEYVKNTYKDAIESLSNNTNILKDGLNKIDDFLSEGKGTIKVIREQEEAFNSRISIDLFLAKKGYQTEKIIEKYGLTEEDINDKKIEDLMSIVKNSEMYQEHLNKLNESADDTLARIVEENPEYSEFKGLSYSEIMQIRTTYQNYIGMLEASKSEYQNKIDTAKYDNIKYLKDYDSFETEHIITPADLEKYKTKTTNNVGLEYITFDYESYKKDHPGTTPIDFVRTVKEIEESNAENGTTGIIYQIKGLEDKEALEDLIEIQEYQENVKNGKEYTLPLAELDVDYAKIYEYLYKQDPEKAKEYLEDISSVLKKYEGACLATAEIEELAGLNNDDKAKAILDTLNVAIDGTGDGIYDFGEGFVKLFSNGKLSAQDYKVMMYMAYLEQCDDSIIGLENIYQTGQAVGTMLPVVTLSALFAGALPGVAATTIAGTSTTIGQASSLGIMGLSTFGTVKNQLKFEGYTDLQAYSYALLAAGSEAIFEKYGGIIGLADAPEAGFIKRMLKEGGQEAAQEIVQQTFGDALILGKEINLDEMTEDALKSFIMGAIVAGTLNGYTNGISTIIGGNRVTLTPEILKKLAIEMEKNPDNSTIDLLNRIVPETTPRENEVIIKELNEGNLNLSDLSVEEIDSLLTDENLSKEFKSVLKTISDKNVTELEKIVLEHITPNMSQLEIARLVYYELGKRVNYDEAYRAANALKEKDFAAIKEIYNEEITYEKLDPQNIQNNNIICVHWAQLMKQMLIDAGIPPESIVIQRVKSPNNTGEPLLGTHAAIYVMLDDGSIICPDLTAKLGKRTDLYNVKMGNEAEGFLYFSPDQIKQIANLGEGNDTFKRTIEEIQKYDSDFKDRYIVETQNTNYDGLTEEQKKFFDVFGKIMYATEPGDTAGVTKSQIKKLKSKTQKKKIIQKEFLDELRKINESTLKEVDSKIEEYKQQNIKFISEVFKEMRANEEYFSDHSKVTITEIKEGEVDQDFLDIDELENTNILLLKEYMIEEAQLEGISLDPGNTEGATIILKQVATEDGKTLVLPIETKYNGETTGSYIIRVIDGKITISEN